MCPKGLVLRELSSVLFLLPQFECVFWQPVLLFMHGVSRCGRYPRIWYAVQWRYTVNLWPGSLQLDCWLWILATPLNQVSFFSNWRKIALQCCVGFCHSDIATIENNIEIPLKTRNKATIWPSSPTTRHLPWGNHNCKSHLYPNVHCSISCNS